MKVLLILCLTLVALVAAVPRNDKKRELTKEENDFIQSYRASISNQKHKFLYLIQIFVQLG